MTAPYNGAERRLQNDRRAVQAASKRADDKKWSDLAKVDKRDAFAKALDIRRAQGWNLCGVALPVLYTDSINDEQVMRDDLWLATTPMLKTAADTDQLAKVTAERDALHTALRHMTNEYIRTRQGFNGETAEQCEGIVCVRAARRAMAKVTGSAS